MKHLTSEHREAAREARALAKDPGALLATAKLPQVGRTRERIADRLAQMPQGCRRTYLRAMRGKSSAAGLRAFCQMCMGWTRGEVRQCSDPACPLYPYRPDW